LTEQVVKTTVSDDGMLRVVVTHRTFGGYSAQRQWREESGEWGPLGLYLGLYDSIETAEAEAFARARWPDASD
jgi:hypothetical protein